MCHFPPVSPLNCPCKFTMDCGCTFLSLFSPPNLITLFGDERNTLSPLRPPHNPIIAAIATHDILIFLGGSVPSQPFFLSVQKRFYHVRSYPKFLSFYNTHTQLRYPHEFLKPWTLCRTRRFCEHLSIPRLICVSHSQCPHPIYVFPGSRGLPHAIPLNVPHIPPLPQRWSQCHTWNSYPHLSCQRIGTQWRHPLLKNQFSNIHPFHIP